MRTLHTFKILKTFSLLKKITKLKVNSTVQRIKSQGNKILSGYFLWSFLLLNCLWPSNSLADQIIWDFQGTYLNDQFKNAQTSQQSLLFYSTSFNFVMNRSRTLFFGWNLLNISDKNQKGSDLNQFTSMEMGPKILWVSKTLTYQIGFSYHLKNTTQYGQSSTQPLLFRGQAFLIEMGLLPEIAEGVRMGLKLNYYNPTWTETLEGTETLTQVSYNRTLIIPTLALSWIF
jgi:hypothetical protein